MLLNIIPSFKAQRFCTWRNKEPHFCLWMINICLIVKRLEYISTSSRHEEQELKRLVTRLLKTRFSRCTLSLKVRHNFIGSLSWIRVWWQILVRFLSAVNYFRKKVPAQILDKIYACIISFSHRGSQSFNRNVGNSYFFKYQGCECCEIFKNTYVEGHLRTATSDISKLYIFKQCYNSWYHSKGLDF